MSSALSAAREASASSGSSSTAALEPPRAGMRFARPQSINSVSPKLPTITLAGLRSRCSTPRVWA